MKQVTRVLPFLKHCPDGAAGVLTVGADEVVEGIGTEQGTKGHSALPGWRGQQRPVGGTELEAGSQVGSDVQVQGG